MYRRSSSPVTIEFLIIVGILFIVVTFMQSCTSYDIWNEGICSCGGTYRFQQAIGHKYDTNYMYICDRCGHAIEISKYYQEANSEATK